MTPLDAQVCHSERSGVGYNAESRSRETETLRLPRRSWGAQGDILSLSGKRILVTRPRAQAADLCDKLSALGATPIQFPTIEITPLDDYTALDKAISRLADYGWVIFTSVNGVRAFWQRLEVARRDSTALDRVRVAAIGPATARALEKRGIAAQFIPDEYVAEAIVAGIGDVRDQRVLLPRADLAREALAQGAGELLR